MWAVLMESSPEIRALIYFPQPYLDYDHLCLEIIYDEIHMRMERVDTPLVGDYGGECL